MTQVILVGGPTLVGKSNFVDAVIGECLNEIFRVLATNGVFIFSSPSRVWSHLCEDWSFFIVMLNPTHHGFSLPMPLNTTLRRMG